MRHPIILIFFITLALTSCSEADLPSIPSIGNGRVMRIEMQGNNFDFEYSTNGRLSYLINYGHAIPNELWYKYDNAALQSIATKSAIGSFMNATFNYESGQLVKVLGTANLSSESANDSLTSNIQINNGKIKTQIDSSILYNSDPEGEVFTFVYSSGGNLTSINTDVVLEYDDRINPFHGHHFQLYGGYPSWVNRSNFSLITSPNNLVKIRNIVDGSTLEITYEYVGDYPVSAIITSSYDTAKYSFIYQEQD